VDNDPSSAIDALTSLCASVKWSLMVREKTGDAFRALFEVPTKWKGQKPILFGRIESEPIACESWGCGSESLQSFIMDKSHIIWWKEWGTILPKDQVLISAKKNDHYFVHLYWKVKTPTTITRPEEDPVMYQHQSRQILNLKKRFIITVHQQHRRLYLRKSLSKHGINQPFRRWWRRYF